MIECEKCSEWYHAECVNLSEEECDKIEHFVCPRCTGDAAQKRPLEESEDEVLKKIKLEPDAYQGSIESKGNTFAVNGKLLFGSLGNVKLPSNLVLKGRMKLDELLNYFSKLKHSSNSRQVCAIYVDCERNEKFIETYENLYDNCKGAVIDKPADSDLEAYVIPVKNQNVPAFFDAGVSLPASHIQHLLICVVVSKNAPSSAPAAAAPAAATTTATTENKEEKKE